MKVYFAVTLGGGDRGHTYHFEARRNEDAAPGVNQTLVVKEPSKLKFLGPVLVVAS